MSRLSILEQHMVGMTNEEIIDSWRDVHTAEQVEKIIERQA